MILEDYRTSFDTEKVLRLLGAKRGRQVSSASLRRINLMIEEMEAIVAPKLSFRVLDLAKIDIGRVHLSDGTRFKSPKLAKALTKAESVCCFIATVGSAVDLEIQRLMQQQRYANAYILDALGSMSAENIVEQFYQRKAERQAKKNGGVTFRFSPGYCDWPVTEQRALFKLLSKTNIPDVVLTESCLMSPRKSISGLFGLLPPKMTDVDPTCNPCKTCSKQDCIARRSH